MVQRAYCGHAYLLRAEGSRIQSQLGVGASEAVVTPRHARCMLWAYGGWRPLAWNRCPVQSCALSASQEHGGDSAGRCATGAAEGSVRLCLVGLDGAEAAHLHHPMAYLLWQRRQWAVCGLYLLETHWWRDGQEL